MQKNIMTKENNVISSVIMKDYGLYSKLQFISNLSSQFWRVLWWRFSA